MTLDLIPTWFVRGFAIVMGLLWGSFLNVVIYRVPRGLSVVRPASRCPHCEKPIQAWRNIPVVSWLLLGGKSACCRAKISPRYPLVELMGGVLSFAIVEILVLPLGNQAAALHALAVYGSAFALSLGMVAAAFIDLEHMILPEPITIGGAILGVATCSLRELELSASLMGAVLGFLIVWFPFDFLYKRLRGKTGMAMGDALLVMLAGAWFGWQGVLFTLFAGAVQGTLAVLPFLIFRRKIEDPVEVQQERAAILAEIQALPEEEREQAMQEWRDADPIADEAGDGLQARIAFGPFLCLSIIEFLLFGRVIVDTFFLFGGA